MFGFSYLGGLALILWVARTNGDNSQMGVNLVTKLSNGIVPSLMKGLSGPENENVVVGPFGLLSNLAMILEGCDGKTEQELLKSLKLTKKHIQHLRTGFQSYCELFLEHASEEEAAGSFNSASIDSTVHLDPNYKILIEKSYCANISESNSSNESVVELRSDSGVMSHWRDYEKLAVYTFLSHHSVMAFTKWNNETVPVPMIPQVGLFRNTRFEKSQVVLLPLKTQFFHLLLVMPDDMGQSDGLVAKLIKRNLPSLIESMPRDEVEVFIPQMTAIKKNLNLTDVLIRSGVKQLFDNKRANLTKATNNTSSLHVKDIIQNAYFSTSFVALNSVAGTSSLFHLKRKKRDAKKIYMNKPFFFFLLHKSTQLTLLAGRIGNPVQVPS